MIKNRKLSQVRKEQEYWCKYTTVLHRQPGTTQTLHWKTQINTENICNLNERRGWVKHLYEFIDFLWSQNAVMSFRYFSSSQVLLSYKQLP